MDFVLQDGITLAPYTTFGIGGPARWFASITNEVELAAACAWAAVKQVPIFILGGGSNVLVSDDGFDGLVLHIALLGIHETTAGSKRRFTVAAGEDWNALVSHTVEQDCAGMECLAGIPGTVGGTPVQNVGAYGQEVAQTIAEVRCYDRQAGTFVTFPAAACGFAYRTSRFNIPPDHSRYIVTQVVFTLEPGGAPSLAYADLQRYFTDSATTPSLAEVAEAVRSIRRSKGMVLGTASADGSLTPDPDTRSAGSFFKNPVISEAAYQTIAAEMAPLSVPSYPAPPAPDGTTRRKLPAAWLLEQAGFGKGFQLGGAAVSSKHTLALTNRSGQASAAEILALRDTLVAGVRKRFAVKLEPEPVLVGMTTDTSLEPDAALYITR